MDVIPDEIVTQTWQEFGSASASDVREFVNRIGKTQPDLLSFVLLSTADLHRDAHELAMYLFMVIHRMFDTAAPPIRRAFPRDIDAAYGRNERFFERLEKAHEKFLMRAAESLASSQPFVMKYLVEALVEAPEGEDPVPLSEEESGVLFLVLKTVIDILEEKAQSHI